MEEGKEKELIVDVERNQVSIALLENHRLIELDQEAIGEHSVSVGDVYIGKVRRIMPSLNAAFVDIGDEKEAFIQYLDLGMHFAAFDEFVRRANPNSDLKGIFSHIKLGEPLSKEGNIDQVLKVGQSVLVQIEKEPISTKGARLTAEISLAGRNIVLLPFNDKVSISQKISSREERKRLELLVRNILPKNYGAIVRTAAEKKNAAILDAELNSLVTKWEKSWKKIAGGRQVRLLFSEYSKTTTVLRDLLNDSFSSIYVNDAATFEDVRNYIGIIAPEQTKIVKLYTDRKPIFDHFEVTRQIKGSFGKVVPLKQGAYLVIEHTEALHVVDVNSGTRGKNKEQEQNTYDINCYAAQEIARQMRLRDMGGIVIVDFIDMEKSEHRVGLHKYMQELMADDRAKHNVLPLTKFGLMQITRQRVRPATEINTTEVCPVCNGTGKISSSLVIDEDIERDLSDMLSDGKGKKGFLLKVSPILAAWLLKGDTLLSRKSILSRWKKKYGIPIRLQEETSFSVLQHEICNEKGEKL